MALPCLPAWASLSLSSRCTSPRSVSHVHSWPVRALLVCLLLCQRYTPIVPTYPHVTSCLLLPLLLLLLSIPGGALADTWDRARHDMTLWSFQARQPEGFWAFGPGVLSRGCADGAAARPVMSSSCFLLPRHVTQDTGHGASGSEGLVRFRHSRY